MTFSLGKCTKRIKMIKVSIFVEGQTERIFIERLLREYLTSTKLKTISYRLIGDSITKILETGNSFDPEFYILIFDVGCGERVVSAMIERAESMISVQGYRFLFALRDLYPVSIANKDKFIEDIKKLFSKFNFADRLKLILSIKEIEAWFLGDYSLFSRIDSSLTACCIQNRLGYDLINDNPEDYDSPSGIIDKILQLIGQRYKKKEKDTYKVVHRIDYNFLCLDATNKIKSLSYFLECVNGSISN